MVDGVSGRGGRRRHGLDCFRTTIDRPVEAKASTSRSQRRLANRIGRTDEGWRFEKRQTREGEIVRGERESLRFGSEFVANFRRRVSAVARCFLVRQRVESKVELSQNPDPSHASKGPNAKILPPFSPRLIPLSRLSGSLISWMWGRFG